MGSQSSKSSRSNSTPAFGVYECKAVGQSHSDTVDFDLTPELSPELLNTLNTRVASVLCWETEFVHGIQFVYEMNGLRVEGPEARGTHGRPTLSEFVLERNEYIVGV